VIKRLVTIIVSIISVAIAIVIIINFTDITDLFSRDREIIPIVIESIESISRLETTRMTLTGQDIEVERSGVRLIGGNILPEWIDGRTIRLSAAGEVIAGIDLANLEENDIQFNENELRINLPEAEILTWRLDNRATRVYSRSSGAFRWVPDLDLESEARQRAEFAILHAACQGEILERAGTDAIEAVQEILEGVAELSDVELNISIAPINDARCRSAARLVSN
jgi:hypothetical protein